MSTPHYYKEERPWGSFERFTENEISTVKLLHVAPGKRLSLQTHEKRAEFWRCVSGSGKVTKGESVLPMHVGDEVFVPSGTKHRLEGGPEGITVLEIITGTYDESDITRMEDDFGRS